MTRSRSPLRMCASQRGTSALYAIFLEWPERESAIASLGTHALPDAVFDKVELLGGPPLEFRRDSDALRLTLPRESGFHAGHSHQWPRLSMTGECADLPSSLP